MFNDYLKKQQQVDSNRKKSSPNNKSAKFGHFFSFKTSHYIETAYQADVIFIEYFQNGSTTDGYS